MKTLSPALIFVLTSACTSSGGFLDKGDHFYYSRTLSILGFTSDEVYQCRSVKTDNVLTCKKNDIERRVR